MIRRLLYHPLFYACLGLGLLILSSRLWLIHVWGSPVPYWDQWDAEALSLYIPWLEGSFKWNVFFAGHNEHRIFFTRISSLALFLSEGRWNVWSELVFNAVLHSLTAVTVAILFWRPLNSKERVAILAGIAAIFCAPFGWENALWGFQSHFYFGNLLALAAFAGLCLNPLNSRAWWFGALAAFASLGTHGGGVLVSVAAGVAIAIAPEKECSRLKLWGCIGTLVAIFGIGALARIEVPYHQVFHAHNLTEFGALFTTCLTWPLLGYPIMVVVMQAPVCFLVINRWRRQQALEPVERLMLALMLLSVFSAAALAYSRGHALSLGPLSRHQETMIPGLVAQLAAMIRIGGLYGRPGRLAMLGWLACLAFGCLTLAEKNLTRDLPYKRYQDKGSLFMVRKYVVSRNPMMLARNEVFLGPHPSWPINVDRVLDNPALQPLLPPELFQPVGTPIIQPALFGLGRWLTLISGGLFTLLLVKIGRTPAVTENPNPPTGSP